MLWLAVMVGALFGAPARFAIDRWTIARWGTSWPLGTFIVNLAGSAILGFIAGTTSAVADGSQTLWAVVTALVGTGFCGALTTFSGWSGQILELGKNGRIGVSSLYAIGSLCFGLGLASVAFVLGSSFGATL